ncbi:CoA-binding protein [Methanospirillum hungatei JF-1]|uniref:acetate--CoA ligase (ADP-forming) n=1 Tax=Methanospirillum hungatei JF-1 (strain ATCC 27890 / DSM 864 / NBRC 100397 / JF-1) TaxID=323259 RepID=Q2FKS2_METHJ|nr:acetate--CoA ligase family protein [Methanospirillum hungatei]ABD41205.1 CoA-binding protein [Methanospirillum hungatei JF-1]
MEKKLLPEFEGYRILHEHGISIPDYSFVTSHEDALKAAEKLGYPVVIKVVSPQVIHKSDAGGVALNLSCPDAIQTALVQMDNRVKAAVPDAEISGYMVVQEVPSGTEFLIGGRIDPSFGKIITVGMGGILVELLHDFSMRVLPVSPDEYREMIREMSGYKLITGFRGRKPLDEDALVELLQKAGTMFFEDDRIIEFDINPVILYEKGAYAVDARMYVRSGEVPEIQERPVLPPVPDILHPKSIAVVGASRNPGKVGYAVFRNLLNFKGKLYPVNPQAEDILGIPVYKTLSDIPEPVEMVVVAIPAPKVPEIIHEAGSRGVKVAVILTAGFRETGEEGKKIEDELLRVARETGIRIVGPNCLGIIIPPLELNATFDVQSPLSGQIGFISQSGAIITTVLDWSISRRIGFSSVISVGNQSDMGFMEYLQVLDQDPTTYAIILYVEEIRDGREFIRYAATMRGRKPVIALKSGSSVRGQEAASSHTGSLAGSFETYIAAFRQSGVIPAYSLSEAFDIARLVVSEGYPRGKRTIILTNAGGFGVLAADYAESYGLEMINLPEVVFDELNRLLPDLWSHKNPVDLLGDSNASRFARVFDILIKYQNFWDIAVVITAPVALMDPKNLAHEMIRLSRFTRSMVVGCLLGGDSMKAAIDMLGEAHIPNYQDLQDAFRAVGSIISSCVIDGCNEEE